MYMSCMFNSKLLSQEIEKPEDLKENFIINKYHDHPLFVPTKWEGKEE